MKKFSIFLLTTLTLGILVTPTSISKASTTPTDKIYENHYTVDLKGLDLKIKDNDIFISQNENNLYSLKKSSLMESQSYLIDMLKNDDFKNDLIQMIKSGNTPIAIGVAEAEFKVIKDDDGNLVTSTPLTESEVKDNNSKISTRSVDGDTFPRDTLSLYTYVSGSGPDYWVQTNAYWDGIGEISKGWEAAGITWNSNFAPNNSSATNAVYEFGSNKTASPEDFKPSAGISWSFPSGTIGATATNGLKGFYGGISLKRTGSYGHHTFTGEYIHTYSSVNWTAQVVYNSSSATTATITLTESSNSWKLVSWVSGYF